MTANTVTLPTIPYETFMAAEHDALIVAEAIRDAQRLANCSRTTCSNGGAWGKLNDALISTVSAYLVDTRGWSVRRANAAARKIVNEAHDCGENIRYCLQLLDDGVIL